MLFHKHVTVVKRYRRVKYVARYRVKLARKTMTKEKRRLNVRVFAYASQIKINSSVEQSNGENIFISITSRKIFPFGKILKHVTAI